MVQKNAINSIYIKTQNYLFTAKMTTKVCRMILQQTLSGRLSEVFKLNSVLLSTTKQKALRLD